MRRDADYLADILAKAERVATIVVRGCDAFLADLDAQDALVRNLEVIGEAVKRLSSELRTEHAGIPWNLAAPCETS